jgi:hypothetical protein
MGREGDGSRGTYPSRNTSPWQFKKIDGVWHRRPINTNQAWQTLFVQRTGNPATPRNDARDRGRNKIGAPSINQWSWHNTA